MLRHRKINEITTRLEQKITTVITREEITFYDEVEDDESSVEEGENTVQKEQLRRKLRKIANSPEWDKKSPTMLARALVREMFTEQERTNASKPKNLDFWRLQWINEVVMDRYSIPKAARKNLWAQCIISVGQMIR